MSYSRMIALISSNRSYMGFCLLWCSIHLANSEPPRETSPVMRRLIRCRFSFRMPAWMVK